MEKLRSKKVGRPKYQPNPIQLKELYKQVADKKITNEERLEIGTVVGKTKWFEMKKIYMQVEDNKNGTNNV